MYRSKMKTRGIYTIAVVGICCILSSCASSSRYVASPSAPPADLEISCTDKSVCANLNYLVIPDGPGAWVKGARWDEYVLTVRNLSQAPLTVENIRLIDLRGVYINSGADPYQLESMSEQLSEVYKDAGVSLAIGIAPAAVAGMALGAGAVGTAVGAMALAPVAMVAAPVYFIGSQQANIKDDENIQREFNRRQLTNFTISGNATITGSVFFPIVPSPRAIVFDYRTGAETKSLQVSLEKLAGLHVASPTTPAKQ